MINFWKTLKTPIAILAPMEEVTDVVFREIVATTAKPDVLFTEFTSADAIYSKGHEKIIKKLRLTENQHPVVAQLWGSTPANYEKPAKLIEELGFDGIDVNMGCPDRNVVKRGSGAALINTKDVAGEIIDAVRRGAPNLPLSVKTRLDYTSKKTEEWISFLLSKKIEALTVHFRTAKEMSKGVAHWDEAVKIIELRNRISPETVIIGNGDVKSYEEIVEKHQKYGIDGVMIGRGIFQNPWLFEKNAEMIEHTQEEYMDLLIKHTRLFHETWGKSKNFEIMKKFFKVYVREFIGADELRQRLMETKGFEQVMEVLNSENKR